MSVGTDSSKEVLLRAVNCNSDVAGNATTSRTGEDETAQGRQGDKARAIKKLAREIERGKREKTWRTAAHKNIAYAIAHTSTKPWNKILKRYVFILRKTNRHKPRFKIYLPKFYR